MMPLLRSELFRLRKRPQTWILAIVMVLAVGAFYAAFTIATFVVSDPTSARNSLKLANIFENGMQMASVIGFISTVVLASGLIGNEYSWNTIRPLLARSTSRSALLSAKWLTVLAASVGLFVIGLISTIVFSAVGSWIGGAFEGVGPGSVGDWAVSFGRVLASQLPYACLAFCVALLTRSNAAGITLGIALGILEPVVWQVLGLMTDSFDAVRKFGLEYPSTLLATMDFSPGAGDVTAGEAWRALAVLGAWVALMVGSTYWVFARRDVTSG